jgi:PmbA/TldA metallopeptidase C-terminal domain
MRFAMAIITLLFVALAPALVAQEDVVMRAARDEMERSKTQLHLDGMEKPYYIEYIIDDTSMTVIGATLGVLTGNNTDVARTLSLQVRVGDYAFDNTNFLAVQTFSGGVGMLPLRRALPLDDDYDQIRREIWLATDGAYKRSASGIAAKRSVLQTRKYSDNIPDFTPHKAVLIVQPRVEMNFDRARIEKLVRDVSAVFRGTPDVIDSAVDFLVRNVYTRYLNSEGTTFTRAEPMLTIHVRAHTRAADGLPLEDSFAVYGRSVDTFRAAELVERTKKMAARLVKLREAGSIDRYNGPVLFEGEAAGGALSDVFAPAVAAARFPLTDQPQFEMALTQMFDQMGGTGLTEKLGGRVMPEFLDVVDRPHLDSFEGTTLLGTRKIDDEGVPTQDLNIVQGGILTNVLATRTPTAEAKTSTGSKGLFGAVPSNLFLTAKKTETTEQLRQHLLRLAKARGYDYGVIVRHAAEGGFSWITRFAGKMGAPGVASNSSTETYKLFADGHEELVRGVEITSLTATSFKDIIAVGDKPVVYHGSHIPIMNAIFSGFGGGNLTGDVLALGSFIAPAILFEEISLKKANMPAPNPPVVPSPLPAFTQP